MSCTEKSRTRKTGERMAQLKAHPLAMASSWFSVKDRVLPKNLLILSFKDGTRVQPPTISTASMSSTLSFASARACSSGKVALSSRGLTSPSNSSRFMKARTSLSSINDSMLRGAEAFAERIFFNFSAAVVTLVNAFAFVLMSIL